MIIIHPWYKLNLLAAIYMKTLLVTMILGALIWPVQTLSETGYKRSPWGSKTWTGPGTPPHWSSRSSSSNRPIDPEWGVRPPGHKPSRHRHSRAYYYEKPVYQTEVIVIEQKPTLPPFVPAEKQLSPLRCGGDTVTKKDPVTGELIIEYITSSRQCPQ